MKRMFHSSLVFSAAVVAAVVLAGCGTGSKKAVDKDDVVLVSINKKPSITKTGFYQELGSMVGQMDPMLLPKATQRKVLDDLIRFEVTVEAAKKDGIDKDPEFVKAYKEQKARLKKVALVRFYDKKKFDEMPIDEAATKDHYEKNKTRFVKEQGGVAVSGVSFADRAKALAFYEKAKGLTSAEDFASLAKKDVAGNFRDLGRVSEEEAQGGYNAVTPAVKSAALKLSKLPGVDLVKDGKETWVIHVSDKKPASYYEYVEIAERLGNQLKVNKFMEERNKMYDELKKSFNVDVNEEFFKDEAAATAEAPAEEATPAAAPAEEAAPSEAPSDEKTDKEVM